MVLLFSCEANQTSEKELTFEDIEKEFGFEKPLSDISKEDIMRNFSSLESYRIFLSKAIEKVNQSKSSTSKLKGGIEYCIKLISKEIGEQSESYILEIPCDDDQYILDAAEEYGIELPYSCRAGACSTCTAHCTAGSYDDSDQSYLCQEQQEAGYVLTCVTIPTSDGTYFTHKEDALFLY